MKELESLCCVSPYSTFMLCSWIIIIIIIVYSVVFSNVEGVLEIQKLPNKPTSTLLVLFVNEFGAKGDGFTDDTKALKDIWKIACSSSSKSKIVIPAQYSVLVRPIQFAGPCRSKVTITILGSILAPKCPDVWDGLNKQKWIYFIGVKNLIIEGHGVVNGMGREWWARSCKVNTTNPCQHAPTAMTFHRCENLKVRNLMIIDSQQMHMAFTSCVKVVASRLRVSAPAASPNTDGIHISASTHVEVKNTIIHTGDDCISIVSNSTRIRVRNITCGPGHGISIGSLGKSNTWSQVHDVRVDGAHFLNTQNGVRIKTWQGGSGFASQITFKDVWMKNVSNPIIIDQYYCDSRLPCQNQTSALHIKNISYIRVKGTSATENAIRFACSDNYPCKGLYLEDIQLAPEQGGILNSFCWEAEGSSSGDIYPPPCFSFEGSFIDQKVRFNSVLKSI
ncbi:putative polygalacturonase At1g80170 isoform X1 [Apium graveolens]|uniref:putative polygalacturonase At1g80170 isoform X1 n=1 Tax=Apium graveolens TaxID=4045 RepID=UPI003D78E9C4